MSPQRTQKRRICGSCDFQRTGAYKNAIANAMRMVIILLGAVTLSLLTIWLLGRIRLRWRRHKRNSISVSGYESVYLPTSAEYLVFESDVSIDMIVEDVRTPSSGTDFDDMETIVSSVSSTRVAFEMDKLPWMMKGGILERRGRKDLQCDTSAYYEVDNITTATLPISAPPEPKISVTRSVFGFNVQDITPPVGTSLWNQKINAALPICPGPLTLSPIFA